MVEKALEAQMYTLDETGLQQNMDVQSLKEEKKTGFIFVLTLAFQFMHYKNISINYNKKISHNFLKCKSTEKQHDLKE